MAPFSLQFSARARRAPWSRGLAYALTLGATALGCETVLGITEPVPRAADNTGGAHAGEGGAATGGAAGEGTSTGGDPTLKMGGGGAGGAPDLCIENTRRCAGESGKVPEVCLGGQYEADSEQPAECAVACEAGLCLECIDQQSECLEGGPATDRMGGARTCEAGKWGEVEWCQAYCVAGVCVEPKSCLLTPDCANGTDCCRATVVEGGEFKRSYDGNEFLDESFPAQVRSFVMDRFEVTVGRLRQFVAAYPASIPVPGAGKSAYLAGDAGWSGDYHLPATKDELVVSLAQCGTEPGGANVTSWTDEAGANESENRAANCASFPLAYAFCIWDGGRLPTEAEWNYAAAGGSEQRAYPWSEPPGSTTIQARHAHYYDPESGPFVSTPPFEVGRKPDGAGRWGHLDLAGNVWEWTLDYFADVYPTEECKDCLVSTPTEYLERAVRGGAYEFQALSLLTSGRLPLFEEEIGHSFGLRCVYEIPPQQVGR